ncbi:ferrochelatase [Paenibacillus sp. CAU 1782]
MNDEKIGIILGQIGTPEQPTASAVRAYLKPFLSDRRVIDYPPWLWQPLLQGIILRVRPKKSAALYQEIWSDEGSPLMVYSLRQQQGLQKRLGDGYQVELGLAYTRLDPANAIKTLEEAGISKIVLLPLFPQYSSTTTASFYESAMRAALGEGNGKAGSGASKRFIPELRLAGAFYKDPAYLEALRQNLNAQIQCLGERPDHYVLSFHGVPERYIKTGDPYEQQCRESAEDLAKAMGWAPGEWRISFQSRFGKEPWIGPSTAEVLEELSAQGVKRPFVCAPGFVTDCLETLHELGIEGREQFAEGGGDPLQYQFAACLNDDPTWLDFLADYSVRQSAGWLGATTLKPLLL